MNLQWIDVGAGRQRLVDLDFKGNEGMATATHETLTAKERRSLKIQFDRDFKTESEFRGYMKDNGLRYQERGERGQKAREKTREWLRDTSPEERKGRQSPLRDDMGYIRG